MARLTPDARRQAIVDATLAIASRKGLATTTVRDVAAEMGTSSGLIHHYFHTMDEVLAAAFEQAAGGDLAEARRRVEHADDALEQLAAFLGVYSPAQTDGTMQLWLDAWSEAARRPALQAVSRRLNLEWLELVIGILRRGDTEGAFQCPDPVPSAWRVLSVLDGLALQVVAHDGLVSRSDAISWAATALQSELGLEADLVTAPAELRGHRRAPTTT
ncbi:MAG: TetR/AcrR family transcriptional regulator [Acidimicrobiia bacterium]